MTVNYSRVKQSITNHDYVKNYNYNNYIIFVIMILCREEYCF